MKKNAKKVARKLQSAFIQRPAKRTHRKPPGQKPGTAIYTGIQRMDEVIMTVHDFDEQHYDKIPIKKIETSEPFLQSESKTWIQIQGLHDVEKLRSVWDYFELHPLIQEDIVNMSQRPKIEHYSDSVFIVMRMITHKDNGSESQDLETEQVSIVLGKNYVLSFQESDTPVFDPIIKRLEMENTRLRKLDADYLAYALTDTIVDHYYHALDLIGETLEDLEELVISEPDEKHLQKIHAMRRDLIYFRKSVWSLRDGLNSLIRDESPLISEEVKVFIRDVYDHLVQVIDSIETSREMVFGLYDMYMSGLSNRMNEVMKVLTIIATIFIPLTFIAGIYGMNFNPEASPWNMPELSWYYGYPASLAIMVVLTILMIFYFRRKGWL
ncbi:magnesium/cobalt transporter CorA [Rhodohalobacter sp. 614A]|uniref:magnesium/cobalt transporter CorA n=1 Tax=Rhodohalobacter sp. 614A TaxID=2908649 RepID=UPI001F24D9E8|nr:magnesium/cobalt transporter CorA [Rhodohalobacter sp. 614A]